MPCNEFLWRISVLVNIVNRLQIVVLAALMHIMAPIFRCLVLKEIHKYVLICEYYVKWLRNHVL
jgi:hypothetical protein